MFELLEDRDLAARTRLGPPGANTRAFRPRALAAAQAEVRAIAEGLLAVAARPSDGGTFSRDEHAVARALLALKLGDGPHVAYVGKLLRNKGVDLLAAAWPLVLAARPDAKLVVVGFGAFADVFDALLDALGAASLTPYASCARSTTSVTADSSGATFPEAFGMVAAEAAAAGVLPIVAAHSGLDEVAATLAPGVAAQARDLLRFSLGPRAVDEIAARLIGWLTLAPEQQDAVRASLVQTARRLFGWDGVAAGVVAAARGRLDDLAPIP